eukprot:1328141-Amorphochlora_amoeboformis.AAC.1
MTRLQGPAWAFLASEALLRQPRDKARVMLAWVPLLFSTALPRPPSTLPGVSPGIHGGFPARFRGLRRGLERGTKKGMRGRVVGCGIHLGR